MDAAELFLELRPLLTSVVVFLFRGVHLVDGPVRMWNQVKAQFALVTHFGVHLLRDTSGSTTRNNTAMHMLFEADAVGHNIATCQVDGWHAE